ncbi:MAG TPA: acetolactate synthase small subunit [Mariniphaga sp.]|nr:acetolactate synthase small subunit [Mariniphaga sp.]
MSIHTISVLVENNSGALSRVAGLFSSRGYNISSLTVAETDDSAISRMTIVVDGEESILEQITKQLNRLIDVIKVIDFLDESFIQREVLLLRVESSKNNRHEIIELGNIFKARIATVTHTSITFELTGNRQEIEDFILMVKPYGIKELVRSGAIAITKPKK